MGFQRVPDAKTGKNRLHLDLIVKDLDVATAEVQALGVSLLSPRPCPAAGNSRRM